MPRSVGCLGQIVRGFALCFVLFGIVIAIVATIAGGMLGGTAGLVFGLVLGSGFCGVTALFALSLWARTRIMERWSGGVVGVYPAPPQHRAYSDDDLHW